MLRISEEEVRQRLPMAEAIREVREAFERLAAGTSVNQPRRRLFAPSGTILHAMAGMHRGYLATKIYTTHPRHGASFHALLYEAETGKPLALFEANYLGQIRTGAATGVATDILARPDAATLGVIGAGFQARSQVEAVAAVRKIRAIRVWSRSYENRSRFAAEMGEQLGISTIAADSARDAVEDADIVVTATSAKEPVIEEDWISPETHVNAIGSNNPSRRELPAGLLRRASAIVIDSLEQAKIESGDLLLAAPVERWDDWPLLELQELAGQAGRYTRPAGITIFKSNGLGVEDAAVAAYVFEKVHSLGEPAGGR